MSRAGLDRKSTRLNSSHLRISYAVFCLKKKKTNGDGSGASAGAPKLQGTQPRRATRCGAPLPSPRLPLPERVPDHALLFFFFLKDRRPPKFYPFPPPAPFRP